MIDASLLRNLMEENELTYSDELFEKLDQYAKMLVEWNEKVNLTAITAPDDIVLKHFVDSLLLTKSVKISSNAALIDVGTGAGFPSVPVGLYRPDLKITLLDSLNKRIVFLQELTTALNLPAVCCHGRAEEIGRDPKFREKYEVATARAVTNLRDLAEYCLPFVKVGGCFAALKGYDVDQELEDAKYAISQIGGEVEKICRYELGEEARRAIIIIRKVRHTPGKYPRPTAKMKKSPLVSR